MQVRKRSGELERVQFDKITARIDALCYGLSPLIDPSKLAVRVIEGIYDGISTQELDELTAEIAASMALIHPDYTHLASRIAVSNLHKSTKECFSDVMRDLYEYVDPHTGKQAPLLAKDVYQIIQEHKDILDTSLHMERDFAYDYLALKLLSVLTFSECMGKLQSVLSTCL